MNELTDATVNNALVVSLDESFVLEGTNNGTYFGIDSAVPNDLNGYLHLV